LQYPSYLQGIPAVIAAEEQAGGSPLTS
jgi:hypothetical protein